MSRSAPYFSALLSKMIFLQVKINSDLSHIFPVLAIFMRVVMPGLFLRSQGIEKTCLPPDSPVLIGRRWIGEE